MQIGIILAFLGAAAAAVISCIGSSIGVSMAGRAASGVVSEDPDKFIKCLVLQLLPGSQGIYGFIIAFLVLAKVNAFGTLAVLSSTAGVGIFASCIPMALGGFLSAIYQGKVAVAGIALVAKKPEEYVKGILFTAMVETYALLSFIISFIAVFVVNWTAVQ